MEDAIVVREFDPRANLHGEHAWIEAQVPLIEHDPALRSTRGAGRVNPDHGIGHRPAPGERRAAHLDSGHRPAGQKQAHECDKKPGHEGGRCRERLQYNPRFPESEGAWLPICR
jgi:hypothetical protein